MIPTRLTINGSIVEDYKTLNVSRTIGDSNASSSFEAELDSPYGRHKSDYTVGNEVIVYTNNGSYGSAGSIVTNYSNLGSSLIGSQLVGSSVIAGTYDSGLSLYFRMEDGAGTTVADYLSGANNGTLVGSTLPAWTSNGKLGSCLNFVSGLVLGGGSSWQIRQNFSVCAWFNISGVPATDAPIVCKTANYNGQVNYIMEYTTGSRLRGFSYLGDANGTNCNSTNSIISDNYVTTGAWHHGAYVFDSSTGSMLLYLDGSRACAPVTIGSTNTACTYWAAAGVAQSGAIGGKHAVGRWYYGFNGLIDEVQVYRRVLSSTDVSSLYNSGAGRIYSSGAAVTTNYFFNDYSQSLSGTYISQNGSSIIGSQLYNAGSSISTPGTYDSGLSNYYKFNSTTGSVVIDSVGNMNGSIISGLSINVTGKVGSAYGFPGAETGSGYFEYPNGSITTTFWDQNHSISLWANIGRFDNSNWNYLIWGDTRDIALVTSGTGSIAYAMWTGAAQQVGANSLGVGSWYHICCGRDKTSGMWMYVNGSSTGTYAFSGNANAGGGSNTRVGRRSSTSVNYYSGLIDDLRFYTYTLPTGSIREIYNNGNTVEYASGAAIYGQSGGTPIYDYSNVYVGSAINIGSYSIGSQLINGSYFTNYDYNYNGSVVIDLGSTLAYDKLFTGLLEKKVFSGEETTQTLTLSGRDYMARLQDLTVEPIVFTDQEISDIVLNIMGNNGVQDITTNHVDTTGIILKRIGFNQTPVFDALEQLAGLAGFIFYIDTDKDLHFEKADNVSSGYTFDNTNLITTDFDKSREGMANKVWVYGDRYLSEAPTEIIRFGSPVGMSGGILNYKPHNTRVSYLGSVLKGSVQGMTIVPTSGDNYGISFDDRSIVMYSGTSLGYNSIPASGGSVVVAYDRDLPIVKYGQNDNSIILYGPKVLKIQDNSIKDPQTATDILKNKLENTDPLDRVRCKVKGWYDLTPGNTVNLQLNDFGLNSQPQIVELDYKFNKETIQNENIINATLSNKFIDITDKLKELKNKLDALQSQNLQDTDVLTRLIQTSDDVQVVGSYWSVGARSIAGETMIYNSPIFGLYNVAKYGGGSLITGFVLGTVNSAVLGISLLGANYSNFQILFSGGYYG